jgi:hypothetical protein
LAKPLVTAENKTIKETPKTSVKIQKLLGQSEKNYFLGKAFKRT